MQHAAGTEAVVTDRLPEATWLWKPAASLLIDKRQAVNRMPRVVYRGEPGMQEEKR